MFQKFGKNIPQSLVDMVSGIMYEAKADEPAAPDAEAIARRKRLQALKDKQEDDAAERGTGEKKPSPVRQVAGKAYGGAKQKHDDLEEAAGNPGPVRKQVPSSMEKPNKEDMAAWHAKQKEKHAYKPKDEELKGNQHKIDANKNGKIDADDFKKLRKEEEEVDLEEGKHLDSLVANIKGTRARLTGKPEHSKAAADAHIKAAKSNLNPHYKPQPSGKQSDISRGTVGDKTWSHLHGARYHSINKEEVEELDELSKNTLGSYVKKATDDYSNRETRISRALDASNKNLLDPNVNKAAVKQANRKIGMNKAIDKLSKEQVEGLDEVLTKNTPLKTWIKDFVHSKNPKFAGKSAKERSKMAQGAYYGKQDEEVESLNEYKGQPADVPFDADEKPKKVATAGKSGYGPSAARHLARQGLKKFLKKETLMGKAGCTSEEADLEESRGHKILATKLRQIDTMSTGIAPDLNVNPQSTRDKIKDDDSINKAQIVTQKDTTIKGQDNTEDEMETKRKLNKMSHGYGNVVHNEEVEIHENLNENHNFGSNVDSHIKSLGHGKIGFVMDQQKDNLIAVHHQDGGKHHLSIFHKGNLVNQSTHDNFENASGHAHSALTTKKGMKSLNLKEDNQLDELSKPMLATYIRRASDPLHPKSNVNLASRAADKLAKGGEDDGEKDDRKAYNRSRGIGLAAAKMAREETELQETEVLNQYIKSLGYDPQNTDKNKKVMFSKTNAFKTWASTREGVSIGQDNDAGNSLNPNATARG